MALEGGCEEFLNLRGRDSTLLSAIFEYHLVHDFAAQNTAPPKKLLARAVELFIDHNPAATMTFHTDDLHWKISIM